MADQFVSSVCAGIAQIISGQPFDTIKSYSQSNGLQQTQRLLMSSFSHSPRMLFRFLYRGATSTVQNSISNNIVVFNSFNMCRNQNLSIAQSGFMAGLAVTPTTFLFDGCKILQQVKTVSSPSVRHMFYRHGLFSTALRESVGLSAHFSGYFVARYTWELSPLVAGGIAGFSNWTCSYPIDVVRTRQIAFDISIPRAIQTINWKGAAAAYPVCALRAVAVNSSVFWTFETIQSLM